MGGITISFMYIKSTGDSEQQHRVFKYFELILACYEWRGGEKKNTYLYYWRWTIKFMIDLM